MALLLSASFTFTTNGERARNSKNITGHEHYISAGKYTDFKTAGASLSLLAAAAFSGRGAFANTALGTLGTAHWATGTAA